MFLPILVRCIVVKIDTFLVLIVHVCSKIIKRLKKQLKTARKAAMK
jgi:hypothetical protein